MLQKSDWVFKGDRLSGLNEEQVPHRIKITREFRQSHVMWMWMVDIERMGAKNPPNHDFTLPAAVS
jgi:hypothetical protein